MVPATMAALWLLARPDAAIAQNGPCDTPENEESCITVTVSSEVTLAFVPDVTTIQQSVFSTRILGRINGGTPIYDQSFPVPFQDPLAQAGVDAARAAITTAGGPGVIIGAPTLTSRSVTSATVQGPTTWSRGTDNLEERLDEVVGPATLQIGDRTGCNSALLSLPSATRPVCTPATQSFTVESGRANIDGVTFGTYGIVETRTDTVTETIAETWELNGQVVSVGTIHAAIQSALFDQAGRLLWRLHDPQRGLWGEAYAMNVEQAGDRDTLGLAGGYGFAAAPGLTLGVAVDHGRIDLDAPDALETGDVELTEIGLAAWYENGPFAAALRAVHGFGAAETLRTIVGASSAAYDVSQTGVALDLGYGFDLGGWRLRPVAGLEYVRIGSDAFAESDTLGLVAGDHDADRWRASAGLEAAVDAGAVELAAWARYVAILSGEDRTLPVAFAIAPGVPMLMEGPDEPDTALFGARARLAIAAGARLELGYDGRFGSGYDSHAGFVALRLEF